MISKELANHITSKYILIGLPRHMNLGDTLIWEAEVQILNSLKAPRLYSYFFGTENLKIDNNTIIVWSGGGYFSDVWPNSLKYIRKMLSKYSNNKHVFLPNSVFFGSEESVIETNAAIKQCKKEVVIFSRERQSIQEAKKLNGITSILLPDVVLGWDIEKYMSEHKLQNTTCEKTLYISRNDREKIAAQEVKADKVSDWPTMVSKPKYLKDCDAHFWSLDIRWRLVNEAINFIAPYKTVYSDRMHGAILAWLLKKETVLIDNSYHKSKSLYNTWLKNEPLITMQ
jgi:pyruvyl transferase EpsO